MGFIIANLKEQEDGSVGIVRVRRLAVVGREGFFASNVRVLATRDDGTWSLSRAALLRLAEPAANASTTLLFDLTPDAEKLNIYEVVEITGRTSADSTDAILHFKIVCSNLPKRSALHEDGTLTVAPWRGTGLDHYEQIRLEGGSSGGSWAASEPDQGLSAVILRKR